MSKKKKIGIFGGTFNPPHIAHIKAAEAFLEAIAPDKLLIVPDYLPPHKEYSGTVTPEQRLRMCELAFGHMDSVSIFDMEIKRGGRSYTAVTLEQLSSDDRELYFLCGTDMFLTLDTWYNPQKIFELATLCYIRRENDFALDAEIEKKSREYRDRFNARIVAISSPAIELSSSQIRDMLSSGEACEMLTKSVADYIKKEGLYQ